MTVAAVYPLTIPSACPPASVVADVVHDSAMARKRRRLKLRSQRAAASDVSCSIPVQVSPVLLTSPDPVPSGPQVPIVTSSPEMPSLKRKVSDAMFIPTGTIPIANKTGKKPQMRYDPSVPMSKEETAAWRREQRRKRNRESAAASRQRQRDRIEELEEEVDDWKDKFNDAMSRLANLEKLLPQVFSSAPSDAVSTSPQISLPHIPSSNPLTVSPSPSPPHSPVQISLLSRTIPTAFLPTFPTVGGQTQEEKSNSHLNETISRPA